MMMFPGKSDLFVPHITVLTLMKFLYFSLSHFLVSILPIPYQQAKGNNSTGHHFASRVMYAFIIFMDLVSFRLTKELVAIPFFSILENPGNYDKCISDLPIALSKYRFQTN